MTREKRTAAISASKKLQHALVDNEGSDMNDIDASPDQQEEDVIVNNDMNSFRSDESSPVDPPPSPAKSTHSAEDGNAEQSVDEINIYAQLMVQKVNVENVVSRWIFRYAEDQDKASRELKDLVFLASGCSSEVPKDAWNNDLPDLVALMEQEVKPGPYPLVNREPSAKRFCHVIGDFFIKLVSKSPYEVLYNNTLLEELTRFLGCLANSNVRALRHTSVFAAMKLMEALGSQMKDIQEPLDNAERVLDAERQKEHGSNRCRTLTANLGTLKEQAGHLKHFIGEVVKLVVSHRYTDPCPEIRTLCIEEMGACIADNPQLFLTESNLKYFFHNLSDRSFHVRLATLKQLDAIYALEDYKLKLELFTAKSKVFFTHLINAPEDVIRVYCIRVLTKILVLLPDVLNDHDFDAVFSLTLSNNAMVALEAGKFVHLCHFSKSINPDDELDLMANLSLNDSPSSSILSPAKPIKSHRGRQHRQSKATTAIKEGLAKAAERQSVAANSQCLHVLAKLIDTHQLNNEVAYVVDSLWDSCSMLRDWTTMIQLLLNGDKDGGLSFSGSLPDSVSLALVEILATAAERAIVGKATPRRERPRQLKPDSVTKQQNERRKFSEVLIPSFPTLLDRYIADAGKLEHLLRLPEYFDIAIYTSNRLEASMVETLHHLAEIVRRHVETTTLENTARVFQIFCNPKNGISARCVTSFDNMIESISQSLVTAVKQLADGNWTYDENNESLYQLLSSCIRKVAALFQFNDLTKQRFIKPAIFLLKLASQRNLPFEMPEIVEAAAKCSFMAMFYLTHQFNTTASDEIAEQITTNQTKLVEMLASILEIEEYRSIAETIYICLCNFLTLFAPTFSEQKPLMKKLIFKPPVHVMDMLVSFVNAELKKWSMAENNGDSMSDVSSGSSVKTEREQWIAVQKKRTIFALLGNLIMAGQLEIGAIVPMIRHYSICTPANFADIFKALFVKCREMDPVETGKAFHEGLVRLYFACMRSFGEEPYSSNAPEMARAKRLALMLSQSFGVDVKKVRVCVKTIHLSGISFVFAKRNHRGELSELPYFDLLRYFTPKLLLLDRKFVKRSFDEAKIAAGKLKCSSGDALEALRSYERSLEPGDDNKALPPPPEGDEDVGEEESPLMSSPSDPPPSVHSEMLAPPEGSATKKRKTGGNLAKLSSATVSDLSDWSTPPATSTGFRRSKGRKIVLGNSQEDEEEEEAEPLQFDPKPRASPAKRLRVTPLKHRQSSYRTRSSHNNDDDEGDAIEGFEPLHQQDEDFDLPGQSDAEGGESQGDLTTLGDLSDDGRFGDVENFEPPADDDDFEIDEFSSPDESDEHQQQVEPGENDIEEISSSSS